MSNSKSEKLNSIISDINSSHDKVQNISEINDNEFELIKKKTLSLIEETKSITLPSTILSKLNNLSLVVNGQTKTLNDVNFSQNGLLKAFEYTPVINNKKYFTKDTGIIAKFTNVSFSKVLGVEKRSQGLIDDLTKYDGISTLSLSKNINDITRKYQQDRYLHDINIKDKYSTLFDFRLNRFPVKTHNKKGITKQYTSRRSDIISFNYESSKKNTENSISFGAMAPYGINFSKKVPPIKPNQHNQEYFLKAIYQKNYSPFSIAASITYENNKKLSVYTDYKFELGKFYNVRFDVEFVNESSEYITGLKTAIDNSLINAESFSYDGMSFSTFDDAKSKMELKLEELREPLNAFNYAVSTSRENFTYEGRNYNTIEDAYSALDNFINTSNEYSKNFEYAINTSKETFSINGATYNTIQDAQDYWDDYSNRFRYAINTANQNFTYAGYNYNTIEDAENAIQIKSNILNQLIQDWEDYQENNSIEGLNTDALFTSNDLPLFTSTFVSGTTSTTLTYNSKNAIDSATISKYNTINKLTIAVSNQRGLVDSGKFLNNPITFDGVTYTQNLDQSAQEVANNEWDRLYDIYQRSINSRISDMDNGINYHSNIVIYDGVKYNSIQDAVSALSTYDSFSNSYIQNFEITIKAREEGVKKGNYSQYSFIYDGTIYNNSNEDIKSKLNELDLIPNNYEKTLRQLIETKKSEISEKILNNQILVIYSGETYGNRDAMDAYNRLSVLLSGYGKFGKTNLYKFTLYVDGKQEKISSTLNKVWGDNAKILKKQGKIATRPGFNPVGTQEVLYYLIEKNKKNTKPMSIIFDESYSYIIKKLNFSKLVSIDTVPYKVKFKPNYIDTNDLITKIGIVVEPEEPKDNKMPVITLEQLTENINKFRENIKKYNKSLKITEKTTYNKLYNNYLYKTNNGVDFGDISIYYTKQKPKLSIIALDQEKLYGDEFTFTGTEFRVKGLMKGDIVDSVTLSSVGTTTDAPYTVTTDSVPAKVPGINKNGYLIRPSNAQGTGLDKYDIHYNIGILRVFEQNSKKQ